MTTALPSFLQPEAELGPDEPSLRRTVIAGLATIAIAFGGFVGWSIVAPLDSAAIAPGVVIVGSHRKTVQHLEGGIVREILVREGDEVRAGQVLIELDNTAAKAALDQLRNQYWAALAREARLLAEQRQARSATFPPELRDEPEAAVVELMHTEERLLQARWETHDGLIAMQRKRIAQLREEIAALKAQEAATRSRLGYTREELNAVKALYEKGYERKPRLLELQRTMAELDGRSGELRATIAKAEQAIAEAELEIMGVESARRTEVVKELQETRAQLADLTERIRAAEDVVRRKQVLAPQDGLVVDLKVFTVGGVIGAGMPIMDIVPVDDDLIVEAMVRPADIDTVRVGLPTQVRLTAYKQTRVPTVEGTVTYVSADLVTDEKAEQSYFLARVELSAESLAEIETMELYPGMPAEVIIVTGERRAIDYFLSPLTDSMRRAFRED